MYRVTINGVETVVQLSDAHAAAYGATVVEPDAPVVEPEPPVVRPAPLLPVAVPNRARKS